MLKKVLLILLSVFILEIDAQENIEETPQYEVSILTIGPGNSLSDAFGHSGIRVIDRVNDFEIKFKEDIPRPKHWGGFALSPKEFEFWQDGDFRLHDRFILKPSKKSKLWEAKRYYP